MSCRGRRLLMCAGRGEGLSLTTSCCLSGAIKNKAMFKYALIFSFPLLLGCSSHKAEKNEAVLESIEEDRKLKTSQEATVTSSAPSSALPFLSGSVLSPAFSPVDVSRLSASEVRKLYAALLIQDQQYRDSIHAPGFNYKDRAERFRIDFKKADSLDQLILSALLYKFGWPTLKKSGKESVEAAFLITWHADEEYKKQYLPLLQRAAGYDTLNLQYFKVLKDRLLIGDGKSQQFNTHRRLPDGSYQVNF